MKNFFFLVLCCIAIFPFLGKADDLVGYVKVINNSSQPLYANYSFYGMGSDIVRDQAIMPYQTIVFSNSHEHNCIFRHRNSDWFNLSTTIGVQIDNHNYNEVGGSFYVTGDANDDDDCVVYREGNIEKELQNSQNDSSTSNVGNYTIVINGNAYTVADIYGGKHGCLKIYNMTITVN